MSENGDNNRPSHSEESNNTSEPASPAKAQDPINVSSSAGDTSPAFRSSSAPASSSMTLESPQATRQTENGETISQNDRQQPPSATKVGDSKVPLEDFDWDDVEERFCRKMEEFAKTEKKLDEEFGEWLQVCIEPQLGILETALGADGLGERYSRLGVLLPVFMSLTGRISGMAGCFYCRE